MASVMKAPRNKLRVLCLYFFILLHSIRDAYRSRNRLDLFLGLVYNLFYLMRVSYNGYYHRFPTC